MVLEIIENPEVEPGTVNTALAETIDYNGAIEELLHLIVRPVDVPVVRACGATGGDGTLELNAHEDSVDGSGIVEPEEEPWSPAVHRDAIHTTRAEEVTVGEAEHARRALTAAHFMSHKSFSTTKLLRKFGHEVVEGIFDVYSPYSRGSFSHAGMVLQRAVFETPDVVHEVFIENAGEILPRMLHFLHHPGVADTVVQLLQLSHSTSSYGGAGVAALNNMGGMAAMMFSGPPGAQPVTPHAYSEGHSRVEAYQREQALEMMANLDVPRMLVAHMTDPHATHEHVDAAARIFSQMLRWWRDQDRDGKVLAHLRSLVECKTLPYRSAVSSTHLPEEHDDDSSRLAPSAWDELVATAVAGPARPGSLAVLRFMRDLVALVWTEQIQPEPDQPGTAGGMMPTKANPLYRLLAEPLKLAMTRVLAKAGPGLVLATKQLHGSDYKLPSKAKKRRGKKSGSSPMKQTPASPPPAGGPAAAASSPAPALPSGASAPSPLTPVTSPIEAPLPCQPIVYATHTVRVPFGEWRLHAASLITSIISMLGSDAIAAFSSPDDGAGWAALIAWLKEYEHNAMYGTLFWQIFRELLLGSDLEEVQNLVLGKYKLTTLLIKQWRELPRIAGSRGAVVNCLQALRLVGEACPKDSFLYGHLRDHALWSGVLPELQAQCMQLVEQFAPTPQPHPFAALMAGSPELQMLGAQFARNSLRDSGAPVTGASISLGSDYAKGLGIELTPRESDSPAEAAASVPPTAADESNLTADELDMNNVD